MVVMGWNTMVMDMVMMTQAVNSSLWQSVNPVQYLSPLNRLKICHDLMIDLDFQHHHYHLPMKHCKHLRLGQCVTSQ